VTTKTFTTPDDEVRAAAGRIQAESAAADGTEPFGEATVLRWRPGATPADETHVLALTEAGEAVGYAYRDEAGSAELAVSPSLRRMGLGSELLVALETAGGSTGVQVWSHGDQPGARALASARGYRVVRELLQLRLTGDDDPAPAGGSFPPGVTVRAFEPGRDDESWVALNAKAFAHHPEQGRMTVADLRARMAEDWFDAAGFLVATDGDRMVGYHWTKVHPEGLGEVYVLGVDPDRHGGGLGTALTAAGLHHLWARGLRTVLLYVEADNAPALAVYRRAGFTTYHSDVMYGRG
jgi:mycothiol synthase